MTPREDVGTGEGGSRETSIGNTHESSEETSIQAHRTRRCISDTIFEERGHVDSEGIRKGHQESQ